MKMNKIQIIAICLAFSAGLALRYLIPSAPSAAEEALDKELKQNKKELKEIKKSLEEKSIALDEAIKEHKSFDSLMLVKDKELALKEQKRIEQRNSYERYIKTLTTDEKINELKKRYESPTP